MGQGSIKLTLGLGSPDGRGHQQQKQMEGLEGHTAVSKNKDNIIVFCF